jgi:hypothetical protein
LSRARFRFRNVPQYERFSRLLENHRAHSDLLQRPPCTLNSQR